MPGGKEYSALLDGVRDAVLLTDGDLVIHYVNAVAERVLGVTRRAALGRPLAEFLPVARNADGGPPAAGAWRFEALDGGWAVYGEGGGAGPEERWMQRMLQAEQLAAVGQLAASVAHEVGAPLTAITVAVEQLLKRQCRECTFGSHDLEMVLSQTRRIAQLSRQLVDLARPGDPVRRPIDLNAVVTEGFELVERQLRRGNIEATLALDPAVPIVKADAHQLQQVLINLMLNAEKAMGEVGGQLEVATSREGRWVDLVVSDSGPGIAAEDLPRIFLPFFSRSGGTGLGLPLARQIVHAHGGTMEVGSTPGMGATFTVRLPVDAND